MVFLQRRLSAGAVQPYGPSADDTCSSNIEAQAAAAASLLHILRAINEGKRQLLFLHPRIKILSLPTWHAAKSAV